MSERSPFPVSAQRSYQPSHEVTDRIAGPVVMMIQFWEWSWSVNGSLNLKHCYNSIVNAAKKTFPFTSLKIYVDAHDGQTSIGQLRRCLRVVDGTASQKEHAYESAEKFGKDVLMEQEPGTTFVLLTSEGRPWRMLPTWQQVIEKYSGISCQIIRYVPHGVLTRRTRAITSERSFQWGDYTYVPQPLYNIYSSGELSMLLEEPIQGADALVDRQQVHSQGSITEESGLQATGTAPEDGDNLPVRHLPQSVKTEPAAVQGTRVSIKDEDKIDPDAPRVAVTEKAVGKKGDEFLDFLERALALYEKV